jgi:hypothetical protein
VRETQEGSFLPFAMEVHIGIAHRSLEVHERVLN